MADKLHADSYDVERCRSHLRQGASRCASRAEVSRAGATGASPLVVERTPCVAGGIWKTAHPLRASGPDPYRLAQPGLLRHLPAHAGSVLLVALSLGPRAQLYAGVREQ